VIEECARVAEKMNSHGAFIAEHIRRALTTTGGK
jgi:hypothetical protein